MAQVLTLKAYLSSFSSDLFSPPFPLLFFALFPLPFPEAKSAAGQAGSHVLVFPAHIHL